MRDDKPYNIISVQDTVYIDLAGEAIEGKAVKVMLVEFQEVITFKLPGIAGNAVEVAVMDYIAQRSAL